MKKVLVALSGGIDSSVAAALLLDRGYEVESATLVMRGVDDEARDSARAVADFLGITHHEVDAAQAFEHIIIAYFIEEYRRGRTPNPCLICNKKIKMELLHDKAHLRECDHIATGHYARIEERNGRFVLKRGADRNEQSYFLYRLQQECLRELILPLGEKTRTDVETFARKRDLPSARRSKSQDICFVSNNDYPGFLANYIPRKPGPIIDRDGNVLGEHKGIIAYTIGQRRGLGISAAHPWYVIRIDEKRNAIIVGEEKDVFGLELIAGDLNFIPFDRLERTLRVQAKPRYVSALSPADVEPVSEGEVRVSFTAPQWALTPGQSVVFYQDEVLIGGGVIKQTIY
jgi:tRNA-specific 2-thiouridylase